MKQITVDFKNYFLTANPYGGWDLKLGALLLIGLPIYRIIEIIRENK